MSDIVIIKKELGVTCRELIQIKMALIDKQNKNLSILIDSINLTTPPINKTGKKI